MAVLIFGTSIDKFPLTCILASDSPIERVAFRIGTPPSDIAAGEEAWATSDIGEKSG